MHLHHRYLREMAVVSQKLAVGTSDISDSYFSLCCSLQHRSGKREEGEQDATLTRYRSVLG
jgi:hypothetical protein